MKKNLTKVMAMAMVMTIAGGATAFAGETKQTIIEPIAKTLDDTEKATEKATEEKAQEANFLAQSGKVTSIEASETEGVSIVEIANEQGGLRFAVAGSTMIVNREDGTYLQVSDLKEGMEVAVVYGANSPMGMSMPAYLGQVTAVVANADAGLFTVGNFNDELTDMKNMLQLNISEDTNIQNVKGAKIKLTAEDIKGQDALVFYDATTKSIPAQTNPSFVLLLTEVEEVKEGTKEGTKEGAKEDVPTTTASDVELVALRDTAEAKGYKVVWQGKNKPVKVEKEDTSMEVKLGEKTYVVEGDMVMTASLEAKLVDGVMFVSNELFQ